MLGEIVNDALSSVRSAIPDVALDIAWHGPREGRTVLLSLKAVRLSRGFSDPLSETAASSASKDISFLVPKSGDGAWEDATDPRTGDTFVRADGAKFAVTSVEEVQESYYRIGARPC